MNELIQIVDILTTDEVEKLNTFVDTLEFQPNDVISYGDDGIINKDFRSSSGVILDDEHPLIIDFHTKLNEGLNQYKNRLINLHDTFDGFPVPGGSRTGACWREKIQILDYEKDQEFKYHFDMADYPDSEFYYRTISIIVYLTNDFEGGRTLFPHQAFKPKVGQALIFPSNWCFPHAGEKVKSGKKRVAVTWYYTEPE